MEQQAAQQSLGMVSGQPQVQYSIAPGQMQSSFQAAAGGQQGGVVQGAVSGQPAGGYAPTQVSLPQSMNYPNLQQQQLQHFWATQMQEIEQVNDFKNHQLPLARIKKIMKADEDVRMISAEAPVVFAKACEMFILELTLRSWIHTEENKRRTLQKNDIAAAITRTDIFDFLVDIVPRDELKEEGLAVSRSSLPVGPSADALQYGGMYYMPQPQPPGAPPQVPQPPPAIIVGRPAMQVDPTMYFSQQRPGMPYIPQQPVQQVWQQPQISDSSAVQQPPNSG
eukprot:c26180_g1_i2 orf=445-1284(+)